MIKNVPKITNINKIRRFFVKKKNLHKNNTFKFFDVSSACKLSMLFLSYVGIISNETSLVFFKELFALEKHLKKKMPKKIKIIHKIPLVNAYTSKSLGVRMGKGKGALKNYYGVVAKNSIFLEVVYSKFIDKNITDIAFHEAISKLSFKSKVKYLNY